MDNFQFLSSLLDSLVKNLNKDDFKYLSQECDNNQIQFKSLKRLNKNCMANKSLIVTWPTKKMVAKNVNMLLMFGINLK